MSKKQPARMPAMALSLWRIAVFAFLQFAIAATAPAAPAFQAAGTAVGGAGSVSPTWPTHAVDDIALLVVESAGGDPVSLSTPAGFVAVANSPQFTGSGANGTRLSVFWARATSSSMTAPTIADPGNHVYARILTYRGVVNVGDPWDVILGGVKGTASTSLGVPGPDTTVPDTLVVQIASRDNDSGAAGFSAQANTNLAGIAERVDAGDTSGNGGGFAVWDGIKTGAGSIGTTSATVVSSVNAFLTIALKPQPPTVVSIARVSSNPTAPATAVAWAVTFSRSVTGVDSTDFALVPGGSVTGATITSVTGSGASWTVNANTGSAGGTLALRLADNDSIKDAGGTALGGFGVGNGDFTGESYWVFTCTPPPNTPSGLDLTCVCDTFGRSALNPSPIFNANWLVSRSDSTGILPRIVNPGYMRLTDNTGDNAKAATVPGIFPASGNYISVEFQHFAYNGSGADGIAVTLSDYAVPPVPGAYGGSLGYAQKTGINGFAGGWIGVALDEFGNYPNPTEGRFGGPGVVAQSVGVRGSGSGTTGYRWLGGTGALSPEVDNNASTQPSRGHMYQVIVDARNEPTKTSVAVNRDIGSGYAPLISIPNVYSAASSQGFTQAAVPANWQISFTGSTGGSTNIHEISALRICAQTVVPPTGGVASGFNAIDSAYGNPPSVAIQNYLNGHIYMKLVGVPFRLNIAALDDNQIQTAYVVSGTKSVTVKLVDNTDGACVLDSAKSNYCSATCKAKTAIPGGSQTLSFAVANAGQKQSADFTLNTAYKSLVAIVSDSTTTACSTDAFSVRPTAIASVTSSNATNATTAGAPIFKAGSDPFSMTLTTTGVAGNPSGYTGVAKIDNTRVIPVSPAAFPGQIAPLTFAAATSGTGSSSATGAIFTYSEVGGFKLPGVNPVTDTSTPRSVYDGVRTATECASLTVAQCDALKLSSSWTGIDSVSTAQDCVTDSYSNAPDNGKYGCNFGLVADTAVIGRFVPYEFWVEPLPPTLSPVSYPPMLINRQAAACAPSSPFAYLDEGIGVQFVMKARAGGGNITRNYAGDLAKLILSPNGSYLNFAAGVTTPTFTPINGARLVGSGFAPTAWPNPGDANGGQVQLSGRLTVSSLSSGTNNRVAPDGPFIGVAVGVAPKDSDGVSLVSFAPEDLDTDNSGTKDHKALLYTTDPSLAKIYTTNLYFGELRLLPAVSSELLPLTMTAEVLRWNGAGFVPNGDDNCTQVPAANLQLFKWTKNLAAGETSVTTGPLTFSGGKGAIGLSKPGAGNEGSVTVKACLVTDSETGMACPTAAGLTYLSGRWRSATKYDANPTALASFGLYKGGRGVIHFRENF